MDALFDTIAGLPVHPLMVHAAVVLLPLGALGLIALVVRPVWRARYGGLVVATLVAGALAAVVAEESGEALAARVGSPGEHAEWGERLTAGALGLAAVAVAWWVLHRRAARADRSTASTTGLGVLGVLLAVVVLGLTVAAGHSGATAAWADRIGPGSGGTAGPGPSASGSPTASLTMAEVARHAASSSCWTVVDGQVYDLTSWVTEHPGGTAAIEGLCGTDGTAAFRGQHGSSGEPSARLESFLLGPLRP